MDVPGSSPEQTNQQKKTDIFLFLVTILLEYFDLYQVGFDPCDSLLSLRFL